MCQVDHTSFWGWLSGAGWACLALSPHPAGATPSFFLAAWGASSYIRKRARCFLLGLPSRLPPGAVVRFLQRGAVSGWFVCEASAGPVCVSSETSGRWAEVKDPASWHHYTWKRRCFPWHCISHSRSILRKSRGWFAIRPIHHWKDEESKDAIMELESVTCFLLAEPLSGSE